MVATRVCSCLDGLAGIVAWVPAFLLVSNLLQASSPISKIVTREAKVRKVCACVCVCACVVLATPGSCISFVDDR